MSYLFKCAANKNLPNISTVNRSVIQPWNNNFFRSKPRSSASVRQVLGLVKDLWTPIFLKIHLSVLALLPHVLRVEGLSSRDILPVVLRALHLLTQLLENNRAKFNKNIGMANEIILFSFRYVSHLFNPKITMLHKTVLIKGSVFYNHVYILLIFDIVSSLT